MPGYFVSPLGPGQTSRTSQLTPRKKRKRLDSDDQESLADTGVDSTVSSHSLLAGASSYAALTASQATQYRTAGFSPSSTLPPPPFPHAPIKDPPTAAEEAQNDRTTTTSSSSSAPPRNLRQQHLAVVTTILHRSLLNGDYARAGRAWGVLLRASFGGKAIDVRTHGRWGIGAEILLHRYPSSSSSNNNNPAASPGSSPSPSLSTSPSSHTSNATPRERQARDVDITPDGFRAARDYFERLILQHPYRRTQPHAVDARTFYPALFGLWVWEVVCASRQARERLEGNGRGRKRAASSTSESSSSSSSSAVGSLTDEADEGDGEETAAERREQDAAIQAEELRRAREIAARLDGLLVSPPYDKHAELLHLRGMVALWIGDLLAPAADAADGKRGGASFTGYDDEMEVEEGDMAELLAENEAWRRREMREAEVERARELFVRVRANGGTVSENVQHLLHDEEGTG